MVINHDDVIFMTYDESVFGYLTTICDHFSLLCVIIGQISIALWVCSISNVYSVVTPLKVLKLLVIISSLNNNMINNYTTFIKHS